VKRTLVAVALVVVFVMALAAPTFAQTITHTATYEMDGAINFKKQMGHLCNTGAEVKQTIMGSGQMDKVQTVSLVRGKITMEDANDYVAGATPLTVTTVWELCTPPKYILMMVLYIRTTCIGMASQLLAFGQQLVGMVMTWKSLLTLMSLKQ